MALVIPFLKWAHFLLTYQHLRRYDMPKFATARRFSLQGGQAKIMLLETHLRTPTFRKIGIFHPILDQFVILEMHWDIFSIQGKVRHIFTID